MTQFGESGGGGTAIEARTLAGALQGRFETLVSPKIVEPKERAEQARVIGALVVLGLVAALILPFAGLAEIGIAAVVLPTIAAGACLALAGLLASSGRLEPVLSLSIAVFGAILSLFSLNAGGLASPLLWLLLLPSIEAFISGRRTLAFFGVGVASLTLGSVALGEWLGHAAVWRPAFDGAITAVVGVSYAALQVHRMRGLRADIRSRRDREQAEADLVEDALSDAVLRFAPDGRLVSASKAATTLFGISADKRSETDLFQRIHVTDRVAYLKAFGDLRADAERTVAELKVQSPDGSGEGFRHIVMQFLALRSKTGALSGVLSVARDVTAERRATAELCAALEEERRGSDAKSHFLASISHELRTPLNAIIGFSDVLDQEFFGGFENPRQKEYVGLIRQSGEHLLSVVNGLLDISKIEAGRYELVLEAFAIEDAILSAAETMRPEAERKGLSLDVALRCGRTEIVADRRACHQILLNLLSNAVKFTDKGSVRLEAALSNGSLTFSVSDTGIGIERADIARLGTPFTQVSTGLARRYQGTGLGLSLVKGFSELHFGTMAIASEFGRGTTVSVQIPLDCAQKIAEHQSSSENVVALTHARKKNTHAPNERAAADGLLADAASKDGRASRRTA